MGGENNFFFGYVRQYYSFRIFCLFLGEKKKKKKTKGYVIFEFVWEYFGMPKIEDKIWEYTYYYYYYSVLNSDCRL